MSEQGKQARQLWVIYTIIFLGFVGISMPYLIFPALFLNPEFSILSPEVSASSRAFSLGITLAAYPLGQFIGSPVFGALSDGYGRKKILSPSLLFSAICNLLTGMAIIKQCLWLLILSRLLAGLTEGNIAVARAMAADIKTIPKYKTFGAINAASSIAYVVGPLAGGLMASSSLWGERAASIPFFFSCTLFACLAGISVLVLKEANHSDARIEVRDLWQRINFARRMLILFSDKQLKILLVTFTIFALAVSTFNQFGPVYLTVKWTLAPAQLSLYSGLSCLGFVLGSVWLPSLVSSSNRLAFLTAIATTALFLIGIVSVDSRYLMLLLLTLSGLPVGLALNLFAVKISNAASDAIQGEVMGVQMSLRVLGDGVVCLSGGALLALSPKAVLVLAAAIPVVAIIYYGLRSRDYIATEAEFEKEIK